MYISQFNMLEQEGGTLWKRIVGTTEVVTCNGEQGIKGN